MPKEEVLQKFISRLEEDANVLSIIVFGSYARGNSRSDSDIDLVVIVKEGYERVVEYLEGQAFEIIYATEASAIKYWQENKDDAVGTWAVAQILFDRDGTGERLKGFGIEICQEMPPEVSESTLAHLKFDFEDSIKAIERIKGADPATASLLVHKKISDLIGCYFDLKRMWRPAPKQALEKIWSEDLELGSKLHDFYTAENLADKIIIARNVGVWILK